MEPFRQADWAWFARSLGASGEGPVQLTRTIANGIVSILGSHFVDETVLRVTGILRAKGIALFDRSAESQVDAQKVGMKMRPAKLLIFGSPKAGTPLVPAAPTIAIDLPMKILIWEDTQSKVWLTYNGPDYLQKCYDLPPSLVPHIAAVGALTPAAGK